LDELGYAFKGKYYIKSLKESLEITIKQIMSIIYQENSSFFRDLKDEGCKHFIEAPDCACGERLTIVSQTQLLCHKCFTIYI
jgi:hypothetical protein